MLVENKNGKMFSSTDSIVLVQNNSPHSPVNNQNI